MVDVVDLLIRNLTVIMENPRFDSQVKLAKATGVSQAHIGNILRRDKVPSLAIVDQLAGGIGLKPWQLLLPTEMLRRGIDDRFNALLESYLASDAQGQETILRVADSQASYTPILAIKMQE